MARGPHSLAAGFAVRRPGPRRARRASRLAWGVALLVAVSLFQPSTAQVNIDGGRSELPGMKQDMFDRAQKAGKKGPQQRGRGPPECPKSDKMSPFFGLAFVSGDMYVKLNSSEGQCVKLLTVGGANYTVLANASKTCGPAGEWKKRIAEELSAVFFQGGLDWVKHENETIEVVTEEGTFEVAVSEEKYKEQAECWARGCDCEQAKNPIGRAVLITLLAVCVGGLLFDSFKYSWEKIKGKRPPKHVQCKKGHRMEEVKLARTHICDVCQKQGTCYQCSVSCPYDMCKTCYKEAKKKVKADLEEWFEKHPDEKKKEEERKKDKKRKGEKGDSDDDDKKEGKAESEAESTTKAESSKPDEDDAEDEGAKASADGGEPEAKGAEDSAAAEGGDEKQEEAS